MSKKRTKRTRKQHLDRQPASLTGLAVDRKKTDLCPVLTAEQIQKREKFFTLFVAIVLVSFGAYLSVLYYGHKIVPNSDFITYIRTGQQILHFQSPTSYKRAPLTGMLQYVASFLMKPPYPDIKAGWLVNGILHPLNLLLLWLIGKELLGKSGKWFALLVIINPWTLSMLVDPIAETTLLFFILLTIYLIFMRTSWCYLAAMAATMVRYEAAALVVAAFIIDMIYAKNKEQRLRALAFTFLAMIPLALWVLGTVMSGTKGTSHYFDVLSTNVSNDMREDRTGILKHCNLIWYVGFSSLFTLPLDASKEAFVDLANISKILTSLAFFLGLGFSIIQKNWKMAVLLCFLVPYVIVHAIWPYPIPRYHSTSFWIVLLICFYGAIELWKFADKDDRIPRSVVFILQLLTISAFAIWLFKLLSATPPVPTPIEYANKISPRSSSVAYVALAVVLALAIVPVLMMRFKDTIHALAVISVFAVIIVSNQFGVARVLHTGNHDAEFKVLADWYVENAQPGEKMATGLASVVKLYVPVKKNIVSYRNIKSEGPMDFARKLHEKGVKYMAWDSRLGLAPTDPYFKYKHLENIKTLMYPKTQGPFKFIKRIENGRRFINIFRVEMPLAANIEQN